MKTDELKKIKAEAKSKASEVLAQENETKMQVKLEELFREVYEEKAGIEAAKDKAVEDNTKLAEDLENLKTERDDITTQKAELEAKAAELQKKLDEADEKIKTLEGEVESMKQEASMQARVSELEEAGLLGGKKLSDKRIARIKAMDDEEFAEYKSELEELKAEWATPAKDVDDPAKAGKDKPKEKKVDDPKGKKPKAPKDEEEDEDDDDADAVAAAALAQLAELDDIDETKITATELLKLKRAAAAFNVATLAVHGMDGEDEDAFGIDPEMKKAYDGMWDEE